MYFCKILTTLLNVVLKSYRYIHIFTTSDILLQNTMDNVGSHVIKIVENIVGLFLYINIYSCKILTKLVERFKSSEV